MTPGTEQSDGLVGGGAAPGRFQDGCLKASVLFLALSNVAVLLSIAASQILLGLSLLAFLAALRRPQWPPFWPALAVYMGWTLVSLVLAAPVVRGLPQVRKFYIFVILVLGCTLLRRFRASDLVARALFAVASVAAVVSMVEFARTYMRLRAQGHDFYTAYSLGRITGFMGHWMTFSGQEMLVLMLLVAWLVSGRRPLWAWAGAASIVVALLLAFTRGVWLGCLAGTVYLLWQRRRRWIVALPVAALVLYLVSPSWLQLRARSIFMLHNLEDNSVQARLLMWKAGLAMVKDRPLVGVGPDGVKYEFEHYRPDAYKPPAWYGHLHNNYLEIAAERGLPALAALVWLMAWALLDQHRLARRFAGRAGAYLAHGAAGATLAIIVAGFFEYNFGDSEVAMLWLFLVSHGYAVRYLETSEEGKAIPGRDAEHEEANSILV